MTTAHQNTTPNGKPKLKLFLKANPSEKINITAAAIIYKNGKKIKTISLGKKLLIPGSSSLLSGSWDAGSNLTHGNYQVKLKISEESNKTLYTKEIGTIKIKNGALTTSFRDLNNTVVKYGL